MDKEQRASKSVNGFVFGSIQDVELAKQELNTAKYIENKTSDKNVATTLAIYKASLEKKLFRTPVGYAYLHDMQKKMIEMGIKPEDIDPIPLYQVFSSGRTDEKVPRVIQVKKRKEPYERKNTILTLLNIILIILIIIMFAISFSGSNPNVLNYRRTIENEYSSWKQELDEREMAIKEKERELNLNYGNDENFGSR